MGMRKGLHITSTDYNEHVEDHGVDNVEDHDAYGTQSCHTSKMQRCQSNSHDAQGSVANKHNKNQCLTTENAYEKSRQLNIQKNKQILQALGVKNIVDSLRSLPESKRIKTKTMKQNTYTSDADYIPDLGDDSEEDYQQVARSSVVPKKQQRSQCIPPMSMNRVVNLAKLRRVVASNVPQTVPSTSNATKPNKQRSTVTMSETIKGNKGAKRKLVLVDEYDDEDDERNQGNKVDMEVDDVDQDDESEDTMHRNNQYEIQMADHDYFEDEDNVQDQIQGPAKEKTTCPVSKGNSIRRSKRLHITSANEHIEDHVNGDHVEDNQASKTLGHQTGEIQGASKKVRGYTQKAEIWKMDSRQRIVVTFNQFGKPVGDEGNELGQFLGTLVRMSEHVSIEYPEWRKVPIQNKEDMYSLVKSKFIIHPNETNKIKKWIIHSMGKKWRAWKGSLKAHAYDPSLTIDEIVTQQVNKDNRVNPAQFKELVTRWFTSKFQSTCDAKRLSRSKMKEPHVSGTKSFARLADEMAANNNGVYPTRGEMYIKTRTRKDGSIVDDEASHIVASLKNIAKDSTIRPDNPNDFTNDDYSKVKGPEKRGYIRLVGRMPTTKSNGSSSIDSQTINHLTSVVNAMAMIIQEHIPNANLPSILGNMNVQVPGIGSSAHDNSLSINEISPSRSHSDNGQERRLDN